jgi:hypothetical protein
MILDMRVFTQIDKRVPAARSCSDAIRSVLELKIIIRGKTRHKMNSMIILYNSIIIILTNNNEGDDDGMLH